MSAPLLVTLVVGALIGFPSVIGARETARPGLIVTLTPIRLATGADGEFAYEVKVENRAPGLAADVTVAHTLPDGVTLLSARPSQGTCRPRPPACSLGTLASRASASVVVSATAPREGRIGVEALLTANGAAAPIGVVRAQITVVEPPSDLSAIRFRPQVVLRWVNRSRIATGFVIERAAAETFARIGAAGRDASTFHDRTARGGHTYRYRVRAVAGTSASAPSKEIFVTIGRR